MTAGHEYSAFERLLLDYTGQRLGLSAVGVSGRDTCLSRRAGILRETAIQDDTAIAGIANLPAGQFLDIDLPVHIRVAGQWDRCLSRRAERCPTN
jgi:hypothetical protein